MGILQFNAPLRAKGIGTRKPASTTQGGVPIPQNVFQKGTYRPILPQGIPSFQIPQAHAQTLRTTTQPYQLGTDPGRIYSNAADQANLQAWEASQRTGSTNLGTGSVGGNVGGQPTGGIQDVSNFLQPAPEQSQIDFDALIAPALQGLDAAIAPLQQQTQGDIASIEARKVSQTAGAKADFGSQETALASAKLKQEGIGESATDEARRQFAEIEQGIQSRYGGTTGTGRFASELLGSQTMRNIANIRVQVSQALAGIDDKIVQVKEIGRIALQDIEDKATDQIRQAKDQLDLQLADIRRQKGELQGRKAELASQAIQLYQGTVNTVNANNAKFKQSLFMQQTKAENDLKLAQQKAQGIARNPQLAFEFAIDRNTGRFIQSGNRETGEIRDLQGASVGTTGTTDPRIKQLIDSRVAETVEEAKRILGIK